MKKKNVISILVAMLVGGIIFCVVKTNHPYGHMERLVKQNASALEQIAVAHFEAECVEEKVAVKEVKSVSRFEGEHVIVQFDVSAFGKQYCGFYYSPDDVPAAFQNVDVLLSASGTHTWTWYAEGDNHGKTIKIMDQWYYFEASL